MSRKKRRHIAKYHPKKHGYSSHHVRPKSRGGRNGKQIELPIKFHEAWHTIFGNLYGDETIAFLYWLNAKYEEQDILTEAEMEEERDKIKALTAWNKEFVEGGDDDGYPEDE